MFQKSLWLFVLFAVAPAASAYIGPGAGISVLGSLLGAVTALLIAVLAILRWPIRWAFRRLSKRFAKVEAIADEQPAPAQTGLVVEDSMQTPASLEK